MADPTAFLTPPPAAGAGAAAVLARQRGLLWGLAAGGALLLLGSSIWFAWYVRASDIEVAGEFAERRAARLATEIERALQIAGTAIDQTERVLLGESPGATAASTVAAVAAEHAPLLRALELPVEIQALDAQGRVVAGLEYSAPALHPLGPSSPASADRWWAGDPVLAGRPPQRYLPVLRRAATAAQGVAQYAVLFLHSALVARFDEERMAGGGAVLFRVERDGSAITILARAPFVEAELGRRVTGPLWRALKQKTAGRFSDMTQIDNVERIVGYRRLPGAGADMVLAYGIETAVVLANWRAAWPVQAGITLVLGALLLLGTRRLDRSLRDSAASAAALARSENQFRTLADHLPDVLLRYDGEGRYLYANPAVEAVTGLAPAACIGHTNRELGLQEVDAGQWAAARRRAFGSSRTEQIEFSFRGVQGERLWQAVLVPEPGEDDRSNTLLVICRDITEARRIELAQRAAEKEVRRLNNDLEQRVQERTAALACSEDQLRRINRELETFTYSVSHDLKAPLRGIDGYSRLLLRDHRDRLDEEGRDFLDKIRLATQQMGQLIDDLLAYSQLERRDQELVPLALDQALGAVLALYEDELRQRGVQRRVSLAPGLRVLCDARSLALALRNLLDNALKFSREATPPVIEITASQNEAGVIVSIGDNGLGFDMKFHDRIFDIFQRLHRAEDYPGTGIGLAIVRKAMERMGGRVWARSAPGQGATFFLQLPTPA